MSDPFADMLYTQQASDHAIIDAVGQIAQSRGVSRAQVALAWLRRNPVVVAPLVGASKTAHLDDAVASLEIDLTEDEVATLEAPYTPRYDFQGISDDAELARISARLGIKPANPARTAEPSAGSPDDREKRVSDELPVSQGDAVAQSRSARSWQPAAGQPAHGVRGRDRAHGNRRAARRSLAAAATVNHRRGVITISTLSDRADLITGGQASSASSCPPEPGRVR